MNRTSTVRGDGQQTGDLWTNMQVACEQLTKWLLNDTPPTKSDCKWQLIGGLWTIQPQYVMIVNDNKQLTYEPQVSDRLSLIMTIVLWLVISK